ncbi:MAG: carbamoyltransferase, partial [Chloroflexi bacterium]|nr:carbamoyltransferase [Chloroflexota bacterium]
MTIGVLGINDGHASTACLVEDGQVRAMASEERFNRIKNYGGPPVKTVDWILKDAQISPECLNA